MERATPPGKEDSAPAPRGWGGRGARLGRLLLEDGLVSAEALERAQLELQRHGGNLGYNLVKLGIITESRMTQFIGEKFRVPVAELRDRRVEPGVANLVSAELAVRHGVLPLQVTGATLTLAMADPGNSFAVDDVRAVTGLEMNVQVASESDLRAALGAVYGKDCLVDFNDRPAGTE